MALGKEKVVMTTVETSSDLDVNNLVKEAVEEAIKGAVDECSKKYFRNIKVDFSLDIN